MAVFSRQTAILITLGTTHPGPNNMRLWLQAEDYSIIQAFTMPSQLIILSSTSCIALDLFGLLNWKKYPKVSAILTYLEGLVTGQLVFLETVVFLLQLSHFHITRTVSSSGNYNSKLCSRLCAEDYVSRRLEIVAIILSLSCTLVLVSK